MRNGLAAVAMKHRIEAVFKEAERIKNHLGSVYVGFRCRATVKVARRIMLDGDYTYDGINCSPRIKSVGAGVYDVWLAGKEEKS